MNCIFCHQATTKRYEDSESFMCQPCYVGYNLEYNEVKWIWFPNEFPLSDGSIRRYHISINVPQQFIRIYNNIKVGRYEQGTDIHRLYWITPSTMSYWEDKFKKLLTLS